MGRHLALILLAACTGEIADRPELDAIRRPGDPPIPLTCNEPAPGRSPLRRLTAVEFDNTVRDLLGDTSAPATRILPPELGSGFSNNADVRTVGPTLARGYLDVALDVSTRALADPAALLGDCTDEDACTRAWLEGFVPRAYRHPVDTAEIDRLFAFYSTAKTSWGHAKGVELTLQVILQTPAFLYRVEMPPAGAMPGSVERLDAYEIAARLSYLLWATMPDETLTTAAGAGELDTPEGIETHARRMLADPQADGVVERFFDEWLELDRLDGLVKDTTVYPNWDPDVTPGLLKEETRAFIREVFANENASYTAILSASFTMANGPLAEFYGLSGPTGDAFVRVPVDPAYHAGILTQGAVLSPRSRAYESDPIHRGMFVRARLFCGDVPRLPDGLMVEPPDPDPGLTTRERLRQHREDPTCYNCHALLDPLGFAFEHFDASGVFRMTENDLPIDATGDILQTDIDGTYDGAPDLASRLVSSEQAQGCFVRQWFRFSHGRAESDEFDRCSLEQLEGAFTDANFDIRELIVNMTQTDAFLYRVATAPEAP